MTRRIQNSDSIARLVVRELRSGNKLKECDACGLGKFTKWFGARSLCRECAPPEETGNGDDRRAGMKALQGRNETKSSPPQPPKED